MGTFSHEPRFTLRILVARHRDSQGRCVTTQVGKQLHCTSCSTLCICNSSYWQYVSSNAPTGMTKGCHMHAKPTPCQDVGLATRQLGLLVLLQAGDALVQGRLVDLCPGDGQFAQCLQRVADEGHLQAQAIVQHCRAHAADILHDVCMPLTAWFGIGNAIHVQVRCA